MRLNDRILKRFDDGFGRAREAGLLEPNAMTLATADAEGRPAARTVLLKGHDQDGFVFYTNRGSRKGRMLAENPNVSLVIWWREHEEQVLIDGVAHPVSDAEADDYFASRPRGSRIGAWASLQSSELESRQQLLDRVAAIEAEYEGHDIPRPPHWSGFRVDPHRVEFWYGREYRLHERICFTATDGEWRETLLYP
ncbi:pyridoxamine 5'-phosphate oxidase [Wenzhouxiangella sp. XN79A]|uniref:pyridoxamine 5'-phosphate oxidase n=1 Tax=Wenzhouxiangella sp. XN79A TaxID=2724193 RepID=UPI00144A9A64|nr:pyridoxamine 5'-phosphate oxidase [Wenzhouxiangella sp. XN79A]NKI35026.1 pyridoxamine 5'-phosphate oxidase [Wenzhouxiangella sp. XN79A]